MSEDERRSQRARAAVADVDDALARLHALDDPTLWDGPAARCFGAVLDTRLRHLRPLLDAVLAEATARATATPSAVVGG